MTTNKYGEPWTQCLEEGREREIIKDDGSTVAVVSPACFEDSLTAGEECFAIDRIEECINAMAGVESPQEFSKAVVAAHRAWRAYEDDECPKRDLDEAMLAMVAHSEGLLSRVEPCQTPPAGWRCTRAKGHSGSCAELPTGDTQ